MDIDTSIYQNAKPIEMISPAETVQSLSGMYQQVQQYKTQEAMKKAFANNMGPDGQLNQQGFLSDLGRVNPQAAMQYGQHFAQMNKQRADAQSAQADSLNKRASVFATQMHYLTGIPDDQRPQAWSTAIGQMKAAGIITPDQQIPDQYDPQLFNGFATRAMQHLGQNSKEYLDNQKTAVDTQKARVETALLPGQKAAELNANLYGSRSPNAELTSQYDKQTGPVRSSQMAMQQMIDNYNHPSPQGDKSLILNAFKIKFPTAPDVNSLEELTKSQAATDEWKNLVHKYTSGGLDQATRDNLMRDGVSTFRANVDSLRDIQGKYKARAKFQNVNDPYMTAEPAIDKTFQKSMEIQNKIGPYVPPTEREGSLLGKVANVVSKMTSGEQGATATEKPKSQYRSTGSTVSADQVAQYATKHGIKLKDAQRFLKGQGYVIGN